MPKAFLTRRERFSAAHRLHLPTRSDEENGMLYGKCAHPNWHGHNYDLYVTVCGEINPETGYVVNLKHLSLLIRELVIEKLDHRNLNLDVDFMQGVIPSTESLAVGIWGVLAKPVKELGGELYRVRIQETENNFVDYYGGGEAGVL